ncbi:MAG: RNA methyltransferase substrate-binding domain-containing protein, partial [Pseudomonadales bacterium]|nr:RNA methyltransferase substrate-binding domain-containing protein [Pseudomonadales bacterium]
MSDHNNIPSAERRMTLFGRNTAIEILADPNIAIYRVHLAHSNRPGPAVNEILSLCEQRSIPIKMHDKQALSRISKNGRQDQGVALDIATPNHQQLDAFLEDTASDLATADCELLLLDGITNPQNLGMIIRSLAASTMQGLVLPQKG